MKTPSTHKLRSLLRKSENVGWVLLSTVPLFRPSKAESEDGDNVKHAGLP